MTKDLRFRGDLWNTTHTQREDLVRAMFPDEVSRVHDLGSGLYVNVTFTDGTTSTIGYSRLRKFSWDLWRETHPMGVRG